MKVRFEAQFEKDLRKIGDTKILQSIKACIECAKEADEQREIKHLKKLKGHQTACRIRIGDYRIGLEIDRNEVIFVRALHRRSIYRYFP